MTGGDKSKGKHVAKKCKDDHGDNSEFMLIHFPRLQLLKRFLDNFKPRSVITPYFVNLSNMENLEICDKSLKDFLIAMGWKNVLVVNEHYYENLVKVFYSNMDTEVSDRIVTNVGGVHIAFDVALLILSLELQMRDWNYIVLEPKSKNLGFHLKMSFEKFVDGVICPLHSVTHL